MFVLQNPYCGVLFPYYGYWVPYYGYWPPYYGHGVPCRRKYQCAEKRAEERARGRDQESLKARAQELVPGALLRRSDPESWN